MILQAQTTDLERISDLGGMFFKECDLPGEFCRDLFIETYTRLMALDLVEIWHALDGDKVIGAIGMLFTPNSVSGAMTAQEIFWFVSDRHQSHGIKLMAMAKARAIIRKCRFLQMTSLIKSPSHEKLCKFYECQGFKKLEVAFIMDLWPLSPQQ